jgi:hypothetical protein
VLYVVAVVINTILYVTCLMLGATMVGREEVKISELLCW